MLVSLCEWLSAGESKSLLLMSVCVFMCWNLKVNDYTSEELLHDAALVRSDEECGVSDG